MLLRASILVGLTGALLALPRWWAAWRYGKDIYTLDRPPTELRPTAIVFGAGLRWNGRPTAVLADRVATAVALYEQGQVEALLMSGTRESGGYDEPAAMAAMAENLGVPREAIRLDPQGTRTIETCRRARAEFGVRSALLVSQRYHLPRALATCRAHGIVGEGIAADLRSYRAAEYWTLREYPATLVALWESYLKPGPSRAAAIPTVDDAHGS